MVRASRVLICSDTFYPPKGGGDISLRLLGKELVGQGYEVSSCYVGEQNDSEFKGYPQQLGPQLRGMWPRQWLMGRMWVPRLESVIASVKPDVVLSQQTVSLSTVYACKRMGVPVVVFLQSVDVFCLGSFWDGAPWKCSYRCIGCKDAGPRTLQFPFFRLELMRARKLLPAADMLVANSEFMRKTLKEIWNLDSEVFSPMVEVERKGVVPSENGKILFFSPLAHKGVAIALKIAEKMQDEKFLFVGDARPSTKKEMAMLKNIGYSPWTSDPRPLYEQAKILIVPSIIPEGFGMACVEAMSRGIPCIVSGVGALPETVGTGGEVISQYGDASAWTHILNKYRDPSYLREKSLAATLKSMRFASMNRGEEVRLLLAKVIGR